MAALILDLGVCLRCPFNSRPRKVGSKFPDGRPNDSHQFEVITADDAIYSFKQVPLKRRNIPNRMV